MGTSSAPWPTLPAVGAWADTYDTLHLWTQIVGKIRLRLAPPVNHWWHVTFVTAARGLTSRPMPYDGQTIEFLFDFLDHRLIIDTSRGGRRALSLEPKPVAAFYDDLIAALHDLQVDVQIWPVPVEMPGVTIRFDQDHTHRAYDREAVGRWWQAVVQVDEVLEEFRGRFLGKCSPVHFFWGAFDHAVTRFSGRRAPERPGADRIQREGYSHEVISAGFWPGSGSLAEPAFYAYAAPEPSGFRTARVGPAPAFYSSDLGEFLLRYEDVRSTVSPRDTLMEFLQTTYAAAATLGGWDRQELERHEGDNRNG